MFTRKGLTIIAFLGVFLAGVLAGAWAMESTQKAAVMVGDTCPYCGLPLTGEITTCHTACLKADLAKASHKIADPNSIPSMQTSPGVDAQETIRSK